MYPDQSSIFLRDKFQVLFNRRNGSISGQDILQVTIFLSIGGGKDIAVESSAKKKLHWHQWVNLSQSDFFTYYIVRFFQALYLYRDPLEFKKIW